YHIRYVVLAANEPVEAGGTRIIYLGDGVSILELQCGLRTRSVGARYYRRGHAWIRLAAECSRRAASAAPSAAPEPCFPAWRRRGARCRARAPAAGARRALRLSPGRRLRARGGSARRRRDRRERPGAALRRASCGHLP